MKIKAVKEIVGRNSELTYLSLLDPFLRVHHWTPLNPGNSQTVIDVFSKPKEFKEKPDPFGCGNVVWVRGIKVKCDYTGRKMDIGFCRNGCNFRKNAL